MLFTKKFKLKNTDNAEDRALAEQLERAGAYRGSTLYVYYVTDEGLSNCMAITKDIPRIKYEYVGAEDDKNIEFLIKNARRKLIIRQGAETALIGEFDNARGRLRDGTVKQLLQQVVSQHTAGRAYEIITFKTHSYELIFNKCLNAIEVHFLDGTVETLRYAQGGLTYDCDNEYLSLVQEVQDAFKDYQI